MERMSRKKTYESAFSTRKLKKVWPLLILGTILAAVYLIVFLVSGLQTKPKGGSSLKFIVVGNWGRNKKEMADLEQKPAGERKSVLADSMVTWIRKHGCDFIVSTGDNFTPEGITSETDRAIQHSWRSVFNDTVLRKLTWFVTLGDKDHGPANDGREWHQVELTSIDSHWVLPNLAYSFKKYILGKVVHFLSFDSESFLRGKNPKYIGAGSVVENLQKSKAHWKIVIAHHSPYSVGHMSSGEKIIQKVLVPRMEQSDVDLYISGDDHAMTHVRRADDRGLDFVISGAGSSHPHRLSKKHFSRLKHHNLRLKHFSMRRAFAAVYIDSEIIRVDFVDEEGSSFYNFVRNKKKA